MWIFGFHSFLLCRVILDFTKGLQKIKGTVPKYVTITCYTIFESLLFAAGLTYFPQRHWNIGLESSGAIPTSWWEGASLASVGHPSGDGVTIKMPYGVDVLH